MIDDRQGYVCRDSIAHRTSERRVGGACKMGVYSRAVERKGTQVSLKTDSLSRKQN